MKVYSLGWAFPTKTVIILVVTVTEWGVVRPAKNRLCFPPKLREDLFQGTIGCTPNSVPMVLIGLI